MINHYLDGNLAATLESMRYLHEQNLGWPSSVFEKLIFQRNVNMAERIKQLSSSDRASVFFVRAAHLYGYQGLIELLQLVPLNAAMAR